VSFLTGIVAAPSMRARFSILRCLALLLATWLWTTVVSAQPTATVTRDANLRSTPTTARPSIRLLIPPEVVTLVTTRAVNGFYYVRTARGERGWISRRLVRLGGEPPPVTLRHLRSTMRGASRTS
jgi:hypothetical protein